MLTCSNSPILVLHVCKYIDGLYRKCTHDCIFCSENTDEKQTNRTLPSLEMIQKVLEQNGHNFDGIYIAGGEPTLRDDLYDIVRIASKKADKIYISTHGDLEYPEEIAIALKKSGATHIAFSLHGADAEMHDKTTRKEGSFERTIHSIQSFILQGFIIHINCVVTSINITKLKEIVKFAFCEFPYIDYLVFTHYFRQGSACEHDFLAFDPWEKAHHIQEAIDAAIKKTFPIKFRDFPLCLDSRLPSLNSIVDHYYVAIWETKEKFYLLSESTYKTRLPKCTSCTIQGCGGYLTANLHKYDKYQAWQEL